MVIQQNTNVTIWGWADIGEVVSVKGSWNDKEVKNSTDENGKWKVILKSPKAGGSYEMEIAGENKIVIKDILVGEVWLGSGQSNMQRPLYKTEDAEEEISKADFYDIRLFHVERDYWDEVKEDCDGKWVKCSPETVSDFSAVAYYFGRELYDKLNVPIGLINCSYGGSTVEAWIDKKTLESNMDVHAVYEMWKEKVTEYPELKMKYLKGVKRWEDQNGVKITKPSELPEELRPSNTIKDIEEKFFTRPSYLYNAMLAPIIPFPIKGIIWYQGEGNVREWMYKGDKHYRQKEYRKLFPLLISDWREKWNIGDFPFYYVQIATFDYKSQNPNASLLRESQTMAMDMPNTGMVVTADIGDVNDIHPKNKKDVGKRLSRWALAKTYGFENIVYSGPLYKSMKKLEDKIRIDFYYTGSGLELRKDVQNCFEIAGQDKVFYQAEVKIEGSVIVVNSDKVTEPESVRYNWSITSLPNLFNKEGLPAVPFRTDNWELSGN